MAKSASLATSVVNHLFGGSAFAQPTAWWVELHESDPTNLAASTTPLTPRKQVTSWTRSNNTATNANALAFNAVPAQGRWDIQYFSIVSAATNGTRYYIGEFASVLTFLGGQSFTLGIGELTIIEE